MSVAHKYCLKLLIEFKHLKTYNPSFRLHDLSSTYNYLGAAQNAVDGNSESNYMLGSCTHTAGDDPWWRVDLREVHKVTRVSITNRGDCCEERIVGAQIRIGNSLENNGNSNDLAATVGFIQSGDTKTFDEVFQPVKGRFVNIFLPGHGKYLTLCEVKVFAENLAVGAEAVQSSTYNHLGAAQNAVDGNSESNYMLGSCTHTAGDDPWWRVDLREVHKVTRVSITNRGDCCEERIVGAQIRIGNSLENNGNSNDLVTAIGFILSGGTKTFDFKPVKGRYVNIFLPGTNKYLTLCEVEVFAGER
uniref:Si:ch1073-376c22.1 n=1 Tax=Sinocyclocheilus anshuiensis TaxID=1608454 RepID=A0A671MKM8_9TELE